MVKEQFGFRAGRSVVLQLIEFLGFATRAVNSSHKFDCIYLDFKKAFDSVPHKRLLIKLESMGIKGKALKWVENYLANRVQMVRIGNECSDEKPVLSGVPQGSILGPLLFLAYVADLPGVLKEGSTIRMFADDTKIFKEISTPDDSKLLQKDLLEVSRWSKEWLLNFNPQKCKILRFGGGPAPNYFLEEGENELILGTTTEKDLGVLFRDDFSFKDHIIGKMNTAKRNLAIIKKNFKFIDPNTFLLLYKSLVRPHLEYASPIWNSIGKTVSDDIEKIQKFATKRVSGLRGFGYEERLNILHLDNLQERRVREDLILTFKICKYNPELMESIFCVNHRESHRGHLWSLNPERFKNKILKSFLNNRIGPIWNGLPSNLPHLESLNAVKSFLKENQVISMARMPSSFASHGMNEAASAHHLLGCPRGESTH